MQAAVDAGGDENVRRIAHFRLGVPAVAQLRAQELRPPVR
jgi:hypothetical protein